MDREEIIQAMFEIFNANQEIAIPLSEYEKFYNFIFSKISAKDLLLAFCKKAKAVGVDGLILPDLPLYEFEHIYGKTVHENDLDFVFLVTPETPEERLRKLDSLSTGFLYAVSSSATTGQDKDFSKVALYLQKLQAMQLKNPVLVGFGIKDKETFDAVCAFSNGAIIGSAYIQALSKGNSVQETTAQFLKAVLK